MVNIHKMKRKGECDIGRDNAKNTGGIQAERTGRSIKNKRFGMLRNNRFQPPYRLAPPSPPILPSIAQAESLLSGFPYMPTPSASYPTVPQSSWVKARPRLFYTVIAMMLPMLNGFMLGMGELGAQYLWRRFTFWQYLTG